MVSLMSTLCHVTRAKRHTHELPRAPQLSTTDPLFVDLGQEISACSGPEDSVLQECHRTLLCANGREGG